ncbi:MAG: PQQ-like protein [Actinomycetia bacterium]|nr:PQQ-like protein [Actinomycetes bacterium]
MSLLIGLAGAIGVGFLLTLEVKSWGALGSEAGGSCGGTHSRPCPHGTTWMISVGFVSLLVVVPIALVGIGMSRTRAVGWVVALVCVVGGVFPGLSVFNWAHGASLRTLWAAPPDRPIGVEALGSWQSGSLVMRARFDEVSAYDVATGNKAWTYTILSPEVLCAMSRTVEGGIGLIGHAAENQPCTHITAVDLASGRGLWDKVLPGAELSPSVYADVVAVSRETAVLQTEKSLQGFTLREGVRRWQQKSADMCHFDKVIAGGDQVVVVVDCAGHSPTIRGIDAATGKTRWESPAVSGNGSANIGLLSAAPAVVYVQEAGLRGADTVTIFDASGRASEPIQVDDGRRQLDTDTLRFTAAPIYRFFVQDGLLITQALADGKNLVIAYGLADARERWSTRVAGVHAMQVEAGRVIYLDSSTMSPSLRSMSLRDGKETYLGVTSFSWVTDDLTLYLTGGRYAFVAQSANASYQHPLAVVKAN